MPETKPSTSSAFEQLRENVSDAAGDLGASAKEFAEEALKETQECASSCYEQGRVKVQEVEHTLETLIRNQPLKALMIAAGVGLLVGGLSLRR